MKRLVIGILAHVDSGKTTLSEGLLYSAGEISKIGRVDHGDSFLDNDVIERERGITIFSKQALLSFNNTEFTLLDTPGHVDFSAETERTLSVLDYAVLVISGSDGVQSHTETLWKLLAHYNIPTFIFVNKMDLDSADKNRVLTELGEKLSDGCLDFTAFNEELYENAALADNALLDEYTEQGEISDFSLAEAISSRKIFACCFGSALKNNGVAEFLECMDKFTLEKNIGDEFGARVFKIAADERGRRLTYMKITGGSLKVKAVLSCGGSAEKANELRIYSGNSYKSVQEAYAGEICAVCGLSATLPGDCFGAEVTAEASAVLEPVCTYAVKLPPEADIHTALSVFRKLEEEETQLNVLWNEYMQRIDVRLMGEIQMEVLKRVLADRYGLCVEFEQGRIVYKETIADTVEGVGHYEPLRHYAEVHLLLEPGERGSGIVIDTKCSEDTLDRNWQRLILTHLEEKTHLGVLTGSPITDIKITLIGGRTHQKHTEGGDFRQATYRAVRQGLMQAQSILLEPWYSFSLLVPTEATGRAMTDLQQMGAQFGVPEAKGEMSLIKGSVPASKIRDYHTEVTAYTRGRGRLGCGYKGYEPCADSENVINEIGYNCSADTENTADSVFCSHGSGFNVKWDKVFEYMHIPAQKKDSEPKSEAVRAGGSIACGDEELLRIFEQTYGKIKRRFPQKMHTEKANVKKITSKPLPAGPEYLLIDGYNIIFAWDELKKIAEESLDDARCVLTDRISGYQAMKRNNVILVFDAYKVKGIQREIEKIHGITVVYTKEAETADAYIEKATKQLCKENRVRVATSDNLEQMIIFGHGAHRVTAAELLEEVEGVEEEIRSFIRKNNS